MKKTLFYLLIYVLMYSCANPVAPTGGAKDTEPPKLIANKPLKGTTNLKDGKIELYFDEYFQLSQTEDKLLITPPMTTKPKFITKGKKLIIKLPEDLLENTTYNITFFGALRDYHENNILEFLNYVFSTGDKIDSSSISGVVKLAKDNTPVENATVGLFFDSDTSLLINTKPKYIAKTNASGQFKVDYLKDASYKLAVLKEENNNLLFDNKSELISLVTNPIAVSDNVVLEQDILVFESEQELSVVDYKLYGNNKLAIAFSKSVDVLELDIDNYNVSDKFYFNELQDTLFHHWSDTSLESSNYYFIINNEIYDTLNIDYAKNRIKNVIALSGRNHFPNQEQIIDLPFLVDSFDTSLVMLKDSLKNIKYNFNINKEKLLIKADLSANTSYSLFIDSGAITYFNGQVNKSTILNFKTTDAVSLGSLILSLNYDLRNNYVLHLMDKSGAVKERVELDNRKKITFNHLKQGTYSLKIFVDSNQNLFWDTGNFYENREPEKNVFFMKNIEIKNNWDKDLQINF